MCCHWREKKNKKKLADQGGFTRLHQNGGRYYPGYVSKHTRSPTFCLCTGANHWQVGHFQAQRDSLASDLKITDRLRRRTKKTLKMCHEQKDGESRRLPAWRDGTFRSSAGPVEPGSVLDALCCLRGSGWDLDRLVHAAQTCAACVDHLIEVPLHVRRIIWDDFNPFNWESRNRLRQGGKTGPNHSVHVGSFHLRVSECTGPLVWKGSELQPDIWLWAYFLGYRKTSLLQALGGIIIQISAVIK